MGDSEAVVFSDRLLGAGLSGSGGGNSRRRPRPLSKSEATGECIDGRPLSVDVGMRAQASVGCDHVVGESCPSSPPSLAVAVDANRLLPFHRPRHLGLGESEEAIKCEAVELRDCPTTAASKRRLGESTWPEASNNDLGVARPEHVDKMPRADLAHSSIRNILDRRRSQSTDGRVTTMVVLVGERDHDAHQATTFEEYDVADLESLDISPSQDFPTHSVTGPNATKASPPSPIGDAEPETCGWVEYNENTQFHDREEASEVFDDVIYEPLQGGAAARPPEHLCPPVAHRTAIDAGSDIESNVNDDCEISILRSDIRLASTHEPSSVPRTAPLPPQPFGCSQGPKWEQRLSIKRDCSFIDGSDRDFTCRRPRVRVEELSESSEEFEEKLRLADDQSPRVTSSPLVVRRDASTEETSSPVSFQQRRKAKRRKVRQLALDGFLQAQPSG